MLNNGHKLTVKQADMQEDVNAMAGCVAGSPREVPRCRP